LTLNMTISLYDAIIPSQLQIIASVRKLLDKAKAHCDETGLDTAEIIGASLIQDMAPFAYQVKCCREHSLSAFQAAKEGVYTPNTDTPVDNWEGLYAYLDEAVEGLNAISEEEMGALLGKPMEFRFKEMVIPFTAENFLLSFAQPNFYFHATTAYDLLRAAGLQIGKTDFLGAIRARQAG